MSSETKKKKVVFILAPGHSGSTLLTMILGSHPEVFNLGELAGVQRKLKRAAAQPLPLCFMCDGPCPYWNERLPEGLLPRYFSHGHPWSPLVRWASRQRQPLYRPLSEHFGHRILIDATKTLGWIRKQQRPVRHWQRDLQPLLIYLMRDGRAVVNSYLRKYPDRTVEAEAQRWRDRVEEMDAFYAQFPEGQKMRVTYEQLVTQPERTVEAVCRFLGVAFVPEMLAYWEHDHHTVAGNASTRSLIYRYRARAEGRLSEEKQEALRRVRRNHEGFYEELGLSIQLDLRWRDELTPEQQAVFDAISGAVNQPYAYDAEESDAGATGR